MRWGIPRTGSPMSTRITRAAPRPATTIIPRANPGEPNVTLNTNRATLKWGWAVAATTALPTMANPNCATVDGRASTVPTGTVGLFEGAHYYHCGAYRPEYTCKMQALGVPFCHVCRQVIWNRIAPLAALPARPRTQITVVDRYPEHIDVFGVAADGRTMSNWWDVNSGWAGWFQLMGGVASPGGAGSPVTAIARYSGHLDIFTGGHRQSRLYGLVGRQQRMASVGRPRHTWFAGPGPP